MSAPARPAADRRPDPRGTMTLTEHLRELRTRLVKCLIAITLGMVVGWVYYTQIFDLLSAPVDRVVQEAAGQGRDVKLVVSGVADAFTLQLKVAAMTGLILSSPVWLYQLWRFITPGLHSHERRWAFAFVAVAVPLFFAGVFLAYSVLPKGLDILFGFTPDNVGNYVPVDKYLSFFLRMVLVFGVGFLTPLVIIALNFAGVLRGATLMSWWRGIIFGVFVFAAIATPTGDPINLLILAAPILLLVLIAIGVCVLHDRRSLDSESGIDYAGFDDDEVSPISSQARDPRDDVPSELGPND